MVRVAISRSQTRTLISVALLVATLLSGCSTSASHHDVDFNGEIEAQNGQFVIDGAVSVGIGAAPDTTLENVSVVLYNEQKHVIRRIHIGELSTHGPPQKQQLNLTLDTIPTYVVIESPDFWQTNTDVYVSGYERPGDGSRYEAYSRHSAREKFPDGSS